MKNNIKLGLKKFNDSFQKGLKTFKNKLNQGLTTIQQKKNSPKRETIKNSTISRRHSISTRILISLLATVLISVLVVGISSYFISNNIIKEKVTEVSQQTIIQSGDKLDYVLQQHRDRVTQVLMAPGFSNTLSELDTYEETNNFEYYGLKKEIDDALTQV